MSYEVALHQPENKLIEYIDHIFSVVWTKDVFAVGEGRVQIGDIAFDQDMPPYYTATYYFSYPSPSDGVVEFFDTEEEALAFVIDQFEKDMIRRMG